MLRMANVEIWRILARETVHVITLFWLCQINFKKLLIRNKSAFECYTTEQTS